MRQMSFDLFYFWRWLLVVICTVYTIVRLGQSIWRWHQFLWAERRSSLMMRHYLFVHALRLRVHRFTLELVQIVVLLVLLGAISWAHRFV